MARKKQTRKKPAARKTGGRSGGSGTARLSRVVLVLLFFFAFSIFGLRYVERFVDGPSPGNGVPAAVDDRPAEEPAAYAPAEEKRPEPPEMRAAAPEEKSGRPGVVIIIDDLGADRESVDRLIGIGHQLNFAVLPHLPHSVYAARAASREGRDVILHLPMEPKYSSGYTGDDAGEGVLLLGFPMDRIRQELRRNIMAVPDIAGVNNHMGSKFMEHEEPLRAVMLELKARNLYFVDSVTTSASRGYSVARELGVKTLRRDIFIDQSGKDKEYTIRQLDRLVRIAGKNGIAVGIGHPYPQTIEALSEHMPRIAEKVEFMKVSSAAE